MHRSYRKDLEHCVKDLEHNIGLAFKISTWQKIEWEPVEDVYCLRRLYIYTINEMIF